MTIDQGLSDDLDRLAYASRVIGQDFHLERIRADEVSRLAEQDHSFNSVIVANAEGRIVVSYPTDLSVNGQILSFRMPLERRQALISPAFKSLAGNLIVFVSQPIWSPEGKYLGLVGGTIYLQEGNYLHELISSHFQNDSSYVYLVDEARHLLFHPVPSLIGKEISNTAVDAVLRGDNGSSLICDSDGIEMLAGYAAVPHSGWGVVSQQPLSVSLGMVWSQMLRAILAIVPMSILMLLMLWWVASRISRPLNQLAALSAQRANEEGIINVRAWYVEAWRIRRAMIIATLLNNERIGQLNQQALCDPLTGLGNRRVLEETLCEWHSVGLSYAVISIDIDHFKYVNDKHGHSVGDKVLQEVSALLSRNCRGEDLACRVGGEEFILLLPRTSLAEAIEVAERIRRALELTSIPPADQVTISLGVSCCEDGLSDPSRVLDQVDALLYQAKQAGRNRVVSDSKCALDPTM